jgi:hypothetical protein
VPSTDRTRRSVLAAAGTGTAALLGGCTDAVTPRASPTPPTLALRMHRYDGSLRDRHVVDLADRPPDWDEDAFRAALNGTDDETPYRPPFPGASEDDPRYARHDGTYYRLGSVVTGEREIDHPVLRLYRVGRVDGSADLPEYVAREDLPAVDRTAVHVAHMAARARDDGGGVPWGLVRRGGYVYAGAERRATSRLLGDSGPTHVAYRHAVYRVEVATETFHEPRYRPAVEPVADSPREMETVLRARLLDARLDPRGLSPDAREIVREALNGGYEEPHPFTEAYASLLTALGERAYLDGNVRNDAGVDPDRSRLLAYGDAYAEYRLRLDTGDPDE